jgi:hypothetical protein
MQSPAEPEDGGASRPRAGLVVAFASAPELAWSNLPVKPLMVPLFQELVRTALQLSAASERFRVGERVRLRSATTLRGESGAVVSLSADGMSEEAVRTSGVLRGDDGSLVAVNPRLDRLSLAPTPPDALGAALGVPIQYLAGTGDAGAPGATAVERRSSSGAARGATSLAFLCLVAALAFLLAEGFLSRIFSHASVARAGADVGAIATVGRVRGRAGGLGPASPSAPPSSSPRGDERPLAAGGRR